MEARVTEIADGVHQLDPRVGDGLREPLLFHIGPRQMFPLVSEAVSRVVPADRLRLITFGQVEADECGSMNQWLALASRAAALSQVEQARSSIRSYRELEAQMSDSEKVQTAFDSAVAGDIDPLVALFAGDLEWRGVTRGHLWRRRTPS